jgi:hypothetical protein
LAIKANAEVTGYHLWIIQSPKDLIYGVCWHNCVRMQKPQHITLRGARASMHLQATSTFRCYDCGVARTGNLAGPIIASAVDNYDLETA